MRRDLNCFKRSRVSRLTPLWVIGRAALSFLLASYSGQAMAQNWNLASDFLIAPAPANPNPDSHGNSSVWAFLESAPLIPGDPLPLPSSLTLLPEFVSDVFSVAGLEQWQAGSGGTSTNNPPAVGINATGVPQTIGTLTWPASTVRVHPGSDRWAAVQWRSPITATVHVTLAADDLDPGCGDGVAWFGYFNDQLQLDGNFSNGGSQTFPNDVPFSVASGDVLTFLFSPKASGVPLAFDAGCDSTGIALTIVRTESVVIDIKPGTFPNRINSKSRGRIPVAILSTSSFDAPSQVDPTSLTFGATGDEASLVVCNPTGEDVNGDGLPDLVCHFAMQLTAFQIGDTVGFLKGKAVDGTALTGTDSVRIDK